MPYSTYQLPSASHTRAPSPRIISRIVVPVSRSSTTSSKMRSTKIGPSPSDGSSSSSIRGRDIRARAIASCCCSPPDSVPASWPDRSPRIGNRSSQRCASARSSSRSDRVMPPIVRFSWTVSFGNTWRPSGISAIPRRTTDSGPIPTIDEPSNRTEPERGLSAPASVRSRVVFPAPFGPSAATISPEATSKETSRSASTLPYPTVSPSTASSGSATDRSVTRPAAPRSSGRAAPPGR